MADEKDASEADATLGWFEQLCLIISLEDTVVKLNLAKHVINHKHSFEDAEEKLRAKLYVRDDQKLQYFAKLEEQLKLENKRREVIGLLQSVAKEIKEAGSFKSLFNYIDTTARHWDEQASIFSMEKKLRENFSELKKELNLLSECTHDEMCRKDEEIVRLKTKIQALKREFKVAEPKLLEENNKALDDLNEKGEENYARLQKQYESLRASLKEEKVSHEEVKAHLEKCDSHLQEKAKFWMEKLKKDNKDTARKTERTKESLAQAKLCKTQMSEKCEELLKALEAENAVKDKKRQQQLELQLEVSAVKIQRWWRQILALRQTRACKKKHKKHRKGRH